MLQSALVESLIAVQYNTETEIKSTHLINKLFNPNTLVVVD